jgi:transposase-like protein
VVSEESSDENQDNKRETTTRKHMKSKTLVMIGLAALLATATQASQEQLAQSIRDAHVETARTSAQLNATLGAITDLTKQKKGDLRPAYNAYCSEVSKTEAAAGWTRTRLQWMAGDGRKYFQDWQKTIDSIANESLRKKAQKRMDAVRKDYDKVEASLVQAGEKFNPFLSDLTDIQKALATDVTAGGVKAIKSTVSSANWNLQYVDKAIKSALKSMDSMQKALSSEAK